MKASLVFGLMVSALRFLLLFVVLWMDALKTSSGAAGPSGSSGGVSKAHTLRHTDTCGSVKSAAPTTDACHVLYMVEM